MIFKTSAIIILSFVAASASASVLDSASALVAGDGDEGIGSSNKGATRGGLSIFPDKAMFVETDSGRLLKKEKSGKGGKKKKHTPPIESIEGAYSYVGCNLNVFQATFLCGIFGDDDPDLCLYQEVKTGQISDEANSTDSVPTAGGQFYNPSSFGTDMTVDPDEVCVFSGTFRASAALKGNNILPIPMASSNGCLQVKQNFKYSLKIEIKEDGNLKFDYSDDGGFTYYTEGRNSSPHLYDAMKVEDKEGLVTVDSDGRRLQVVVDSHGRHLFFKIAGKIFEKASTLTLTLTIRLVDAVCAF
mmetsp:Transcript_14690/g.16530  ORF Transcript_14690/g.16530 Transcript_14690/m.16530 type:complete len:301 (+) Transcript_14690:550-1452(+)